MKNMEWHGDKVLANVRKATPEAITKACVIVQSAAVPMAPLKTGALRNSIEYVVKDNEGKVGPNAGKEGLGKGYSYWQEYGTWKMAASPYMRPAADNNRARVQRELGVTIGKAAEAGGKR